METNEQKAKEIARLKRITKNEKYEHPFQLEIYERCLEMAEWKDKQFIEALSELQKTVEDLRLKIRIFRKNYEKRGQSK